MSGTLIWAAPGWLVPAAAITVVAVAMIVWAYGRAAAGWPIRAVAGLLKTVAIVALAVCLVEPLVSGIRPRPGANLLLLVADNSQSLQVRDRGQRQTRGQQLRRQLAEPSRWQTRLAQQFDVRRYVFDARLHPVADFSKLTLDGHASALASALSTLAKRFRGRPVAGIVVLSDGNATDWDQHAIDFDQLPPVYPVLLGGEGPAEDISVTEVAVSQTNFEAAPVTISAEVTCYGLAGQPLVVQLLDEQDRPVQQQPLTAAADGQPLAVRFQLRPEKHGICFYRVRAFAKGAARQFAHPETSSEATLANNSRLALVDRGGGPYRVLYVSGRPNWELKFLRRALEEDDEIQLVALVRMAKREPKFTFRGRAGERTNPLYRGFGNQDDEEAEQYDQPVLLRLGVDDPAELRDGFPKAADQLFAYHALVLDDLEAGFFTPDQMSLVQQFVSRRGGGLLMLGGQDTFVHGQYQHTAIGQLLPVYLDRLSPKPPGQTYRLALTREGWLQPWVRLRSTQQDEQKRLARMPSLKTLTRVRQIKPGASVLAQVEGSDGRRWPALVAHRFGQGRVGALLLGDLWRWHLRRRDWSQSDLEKAWRQTIRWLVADVPQRVEVVARRKADQPGSAITLRTQVRDATFQPLDNASVQVQVRTPTGKTIKLTAEPSSDEPGVYLTDFVSRTPGPYRASVTALAADGSQVGRRQTGWTCEPATDELRALSPNRPLMQRIADRTGGQLIGIERLPQLAATMPNRKVPVTQPWVWPLWHQWTVLVLAIGCLVGEWGLRRFKGLP